MDFFLSPQKNFCGRGALGVSNSGWISVSVGKLIVTENTELFLKKIP